MHSSGSSILSHFLEVLNSLVFRDVSLALVDNLSAFESWSFKLICRVLFVVMKKEIAGGYDRRGGVRADRL